MFNFLIALMLNTGDVEARHNRGRNHNHHRRAHAHHNTRPTPPPNAVARNVNIRWHNNYWVYPHASPGFIWKWVPGHFNRRGTWIRGRWSIVIKF